MHTLIKKKTKKFLVLVNILECCAWIHALTTRHRNCSNIFIGLDSLFDLKILNVYTSDFSELNLVASILPSSGIKESRKHGRVQNV